MENCVCYEKLSHRKEIDFQIHESVKKNRKPTISHQIKCKYTLKEKK